MKNKIITHFYVKEARKDSIGLAPIYLRITINGERAEISTDKKINPECWDKSNERVAGRSEPAKIINAFLDTLTGKVGKYFSNLEAKARVVLMLTIDNDDPTLRKLSVSKGNYIPYELKRRGIVLRANENFVFEYLTEVENSGSQSNESDKRRADNEEAVKMLPGQGKKPTEIITELPSLVRDPYKKSAIREIINRLKDQEKGKDEESTSTPLA